MGDDRKTLKADVKVEDHELFQTYQIKQVLFLTATFDSTY